MTKLAGYVKTSYRNLPLGHAVPRAFCTLVSSAWQVDGLGFGEITYPRFLPQNWTGIWLG